MKSLRVANLAVVEKLEVSFAPGLNVITGETGAGKSVLMGALELALGARADAGAVRDGAKEAEVEADFGSHVVRRTVSASGKSRAWIDDESVAVAELRELAAGLVDVHGPDANHALLDANFQRATLDAFGKVDLSRYRGQFEKWSATMRRISELNNDVAGEDELDLLRYQIGELESASLVPEDDTLQERHAAAAHAVDIVENATAVTEALGGDSGIEETFAAIRPRLAAIARHLPVAEEWSSEVESLAAGVEELSRSIADAVSSLDSGEESFKELDDRLSLVGRLSRKYLKGSAQGGAATRLLEVLAAKRARLDLIENREAELDKLKTRAEDEKKAMLESAALVTAERRKAATRFSRAVEKELKELGFAKARFGVSISQAEPQAHGCDDISYMFEPNPGEPARPLASIASSGETARVMLAVKIVTAADPGRTLVFDEVDANVGGETARAVGEKLLFVSKGTQVIAITHLPQSAAYADRHLAVRKSVEGGRTRTTVETVEGEARIEELSRMLGGGTLTHVVRRHAQELLLIKEKAEEKWK